MLGLAAAMLTGVPAATWLGQQFGWRSAYWTVVVLAAMTVAAVLAVVPSTPGRPEATVRGELGALRRPQVLLTLLVGIVGFGGMFALYSYIAPRRHRRRRSSPAARCRVVLLVYGAGGVVGHGARRPAGRPRAVPLAGRVARRPRRAARRGRADLALRRSRLFVGVFLVSVAASTLAICLQMRLMETAGEAQMLGAALNHSALNLANALGAWLGGLVIAAGLGYRAPSVVGAGLAALGLLPLAISAVLRRRAAAGAGPAAPCRGRLAAGDPGARRLTGRRGCNQAATLHRQRRGRRTRPEKPRTFRAFRRRSAPVGRHRGPSPLVRSGQARPPTARLRRVARE